MDLMSLLTGPERRRRWSEDERRQILTAAFAPGAIVADISRRYEISTSPIYKWRRQRLAMESSARFAPAIVIDEPASAAPEAVAITVEFTGDARLRISATAPGIGDDDVAGAATIPIASSGGLNMMVQDKRGRGLSALEAATQDMVGAANQIPGLTGVFSLFNTRTHKVRAPGEEEGSDRWKAAEKAARRRLRPILMTSFAFILGVLPLAIATGAGAEMRQSLGHQRLLRHARRYWFRLDLHPGILRRGPWALRQATRRAEVRRPVAAGFHAGALIWRSTLEAGEITGVGGRGGD
jgi:transposase